MTTKTFAPLALAAALFAAGCGSDAVDDGSGDFAEGEAAFAVGDFKRAAVSYGEAARKCPTNFEAHVSLALAACELGDVPAAAAAADAAVALDPASAEARLVAGEAAYLGKDYARAKEHFDAVSGAKSLPAELRAQAFVSRAVAEIAENETAFARLSLWRALRVDRRNAAAWYHLGYLSRNVYHFAAAALEQYQFCAKLSAPGEERTQEIVRKTIPSVRAAVAAAAASRPGVDKRDPAAAAKLLAEGEAALKAKKPAKPVRGKKGKAKAAPENPEKVALEKFERAFAADPLSYPAARAYADALSRAAGVKGGADRVLDVYVAALDANPSSSETYLVSARYALRNQRAIRAAEILSRALAFNPDSKTVMDLYVEALGKSGKTREAAAYKAFRREM